MTIKDVLKKDFNDLDKLNLKRFKSSKFLFVTMCLLFFLNYFFLSNFPENNFLIIILPITYTLFVISLLLLTYFSIKIKLKNKINSVYLIVIIIFLIIIGIISSIPFLIDGKTLSNLI